MSRGWWIGAAFLPLWANSLTAQTALPSPLQWLYPRGTVEALALQPTPSAPQALDSFRIKWREPALAGPGALLVGRVIPSEKLLPQLPWAPNDIVGIGGDTLYVISGAGWIRARLPLPPFVWDVCALLDTTAPIPRSYSPAPTVIAMQSAEHLSPDSSAVSYLAGASGDTLRLLRRLFVDMRRYAPNLAAALFPFAARSTLDRTFYYALAHSTAPSEIPGHPEPYLRGVLQFISDSSFASIPIPNLPDVPSARTVYAPAIWLTQPSLTLLPGGVLRLLLPLQPDSLRQTPVLNRLGHRTRADSAYLIGIDLQGDSPSTGIAPLALPLDSAARFPIVLPFWVYLQPDPAAGQRPFIVVAEGYTGRGSSGRARLHLYDAAGAPLASPLLPTSPPFSGSTNHLWGLSCGDIDGTASAPPYYPNNPGMEIVAVPNTPYVATPNARLYVLRYRSGPPVPKPQPPGSFLFPFDTIVSAPCSGWLLGSADLDGDGRYEILLADRESLQIWRLRSYSDPRFSAGFPFDTLVAIPFPGETILSSVVADVEGDGRADILLRTDRALYCVGVSLPKGFSVASPATDTALCVTDTLRLHLVNHLRGHNPVRILFQPYERGRPTGPPRTLYDTYPSDTDTVLIRLPLSALLPSSSGRIVISSVLIPAARDSSPILTVLYPTLSLNVPAEGDTLTIGDSLRIAGTCQCASVVEIADSMAGTVLLRVTPDSTGSFSATLLVPCPPEASCWAPLPQLLLRVSARSDTFTAVRILSLARRPARPEVELVFAPEGICPEIILTGTTTACPTPRLGYSTDGGQSFQELLTSAGNNPQWRLPPVQTDALLLRLCCSGCVWVDTLLALTFPLMIHLLAPNPFQPPEQLLYITYSFSASGSARLRILDAANNLVRELVPWSSHEPNMLYCTTWDGTAHNGALVAMGTYYLLIEHQQRRWLFPVFVRLR